jgi:pimeloyl-ACP methyl ester carboxylesterase
MWGDVFLYGGIRIQEHVHTAAHRLLDGQDLRLATGTFDECYEAFERLKAARGIERRSRHLVLMLHGIFRTKETFTPMRRALIREGYEAEAVNYPSTQQTLEDHARQVHLLLDRSDDVDEVSFVTHSMGGLVARVVLGMEAEWRERIAVHRLVMIGTPNHGAEIAQDLWKLQAFRRLAGPAGMQLQPHEAAEIPTPSCEFGVIAGGTGDDRGFNPLLSGDNDMTVRVQSALLEGAQDTLLVRAIHTFLANRPEVIDAVIRFLGSGRFGPTAPGPVPVDAVEL